ncbi:hypothetical protein ACQCSX_06895 [Pseudarthrobacter sp. P1]
MNTTPLPPEQEREHSEAPAEGLDGVEVPEFRHHSQQPAEGPDDDSVDGG